MSANGLIALAIQGVVFPPFAEWVGIWRVFTVVTILHPVAYFIVPYIVYLPENLLYPGIYVCLAIRNLLHIMAYPIILILLKEASPAPSVLGKINGLAASAGAACRTISPPMAGYLYSIGAQQGFTGLAWWASGFVAIFGGIQLFWIEREKNKTAVVRSLAPCLAMAESEDGMREVVHIVVTEVDV
ncbi:MAG: MFS transporter [Lasallia pustulata]|uniref:MFS transporter n=1 Tax=Lasallia pustulata TaxID=136370 RepID=A0A5M8PU66_9LECA|nr:MAG: MFS transporter [Lasallia pustulata]